MAGMNVLKDGVIAVQFSQQDLMMALAAVSKESSFIKNLPDIPMQVMLTVSTQTLLRDLQQKESTPDTWMTLLITFAPDFPDWVKEKKTEGEAYSNVIPFKR